MSEHSGNGIEFGASIARFCGPKTADRTGLLINRIRRWGGAIAGILFVSTVGAAEITLYEDPGFNGGQLTLRGYTPNIGNTGFNDRASSVVVNSGRWEV